MIVVLHTVISPASGRPISSRISAVDNRAQKEHQLGYGRFRCAVISADNSCLHQVVTGFIALHFNGAGTALGDVDNDDALFAGIMQAA